MITSVNPGVDPTHEAVRERYAAAARSSLSTATEDQGCCGSPASDPMTSGNYDEADTPFAAALAASLGCGNPTALAELRPGEVVLDLGSGGGLDVLLSARRVGPTGRAYGLDMTPEMLQLAERNRAEAGVDNATFLQGTIEQIPLPDAEVDVVISNCVVNLSPDKDAVIGESYRVLRPGGRFAVSDIVLLRDLPPELSEVMALWTGCISGALRDEDFVSRLQATGFTDAHVEVTRRYDRAALLELADALADTDLPAGMTRAQAAEAMDDSFASAFIRATKPEAVPS